LKYVIFIRRIIIIMSGLWRLFIKNLKLGETTAPNS